MKNILSEITQEEKNRILEMHKTTTSKFYLNEDVTGLPQLTDLYNEILTEFIKIIQPKINSILGTDQFILKPMNDGTQIWFKVENKKNVFKNRNTAQTEDKFKIGDATNAVLNVTKFFKWLENQDVYIESIIKDTDKLYFGKTRKLEDFWLQDDWSNAVDQVERKGYFDKSFSYQEK
jgi:hypothetical protein